ncbi:MAG: hypothetical protein FWD41_00575 [Actinomycetia bacterium]|nr:hypothetical protein [Actinomycetes bacterium]
MTPHELVVDITDRFGPRPATSTSERHAAEWFAQQCDQYGLAVEIQEFDTTRSSGFSLALLYFLPLIPILASRFTREIPFVNWLWVILLAACIVLLALQLRGRSFLNAIFPKGPSQNVVARCNDGTTGDKLRKVVFVSHLDTPFVSPLNTEATATLHRRLTDYAFYYLLAALPLLAFLAFDFDFMEFTLFDVAIDLQLWLWVLLAILSVVPAILALDALVMSLLRKQSPGANDSASGLAVLLSMVEALARERGGTIESHEFSTASMSAVSADEQLRQASDLDQPGLTDWLELDDMFDTRADAHASNSTFGPWETLDSNTGSFEATSAAPAQRTTVTQPMRTVANIGGLSSGMYGLEGFSAMLDGKEVWFVATGARHADAAGMQALLYEYGEELRDALIVNLESVGLGNLQWYTREGAPLTVSISSRVMSLAKRAAREKDLRISPYKGVTGITDATPALTHHHKAGTITRLLSKGFPEAYRTVDDFADATDAVVLDETVQFALEFLAQA